MKNVGGIVRIGGDEGVIDATADGDGAVRVMAVNFDEAFDYDRACPVSVRPEGLADGLSWRCRHYRIDRDHSNAYTAWLELGRPVVPDDGQLAAIIARHGLEEMEPERTLDCVNGAPQLEAELPPHAVSLWTLDRTEP